MPGFAILFKTKVSPSQHKSVYILKVQGLEDPPGSVVGPCYFRQRLALLAPVGKHWIDVSLPPVQKDGWVI